MSCPCVDDTTEEYVNFVFGVPRDVDTGGTVTFRVACVPAAAAAGKNVAHSLGFRAVASGEDFDGSYGEVDSGDRAVEGTQDEISVHSGPRPWPTLAGRPATSYLRVTADRRRARITSAATFTCFR